MSPPHSDYDLVDETAVTVGLGLVLLGAGLLGVVETLLGSVHVSKRISGIGVVVVHTSFAPHLRASVVALGLVVLFVWALYRVGRTMRAS